jgi:hypothetical protein
MDELRGIERILCIHIFGDRIFHSVIERTIVDRRTEDSGAAEDVERC